MSDAHQSTQWHMEAKTVAKSKPDELEQIKRTVACVIRWSRTRATATHPDFWQERRSAAFGSLPCSDEQHPVTFWCHRPCWLWTLPDPVKHHTHHPIRMRGLLMGWAVLFQVPSDSNLRQRIWSLNRSPEGSTLDPTMWRVMAVTNDLHDSVTWSPQKHFIQILWPVQMGWYNCGIRGRFKTHNVAMTEAHVGYRCWPLPV